MALNVKVGLIGPLDMLNFKNQPKRRRAAIEKASASPLPTQYATNAKAAALHPATQQLTVEQVIEHSKDVKSYVLAGQGGKAAYFRAGQYLSIELSIGGSRLTRPYSISSSPKLALDEGRYYITVKRAGFASDYILDHWQPGVTVKASAPQGQFYYEPLRDAGLVIGAAGGSGITPFLSMAYAIRDGLEDFRLTVLYGSRTKQDVLFEAEFAAISKQTDKVRLINVLSDETGEGCESGFLTAELIQKYAENSPYSVFMCGPRAMYRFLEGETAKLDLARKFLRQELFGIDQQPWLAEDYPHGKEAAIYQMMVHHAGGVATVQASGKETVLTALERAGISAPSRCRSGECGYCHSKLLSGDLYIPADNDGRRRADLVYGYIHPCASFPTSNLELELPGAY